MERGAPLAVRLDAPAEAALGELCRRWGCNRATAVRRALVEAADRDMAAVLRPVVEALARLEARPCGASVAAPVPADAPAPQAPAPQDPEAPVSPRAAARVANLLSAGGWG